MLRSDEHQRRSPDCMFFSLTASKQSRPARNKKDRTSKASRLSTQSNFTSISEAPSLAEIQVEEGDSAVTTAADAITTSTMPKTVKRGLRPKKPAAKGKKSTAVLALEPEQTSSFIEPEDDDFEVKVGPLPSKSTRGKKRTSAEMDANTSTQDRGAISDATITQPPPAKRQATRSRNTLSQAHAVPNELHNVARDVDAPMTDAESMSPPQVITSKKGGKGGRKRASSSTRTVSTASTASMASLRATVPPDEEIDAALEAELDRPLTDEEPDIAEIQEEEERPKTRRLTRTRPGSRKATASMAPMRKTRASTHIKELVVDIQEQTTETKTLDDPSGLVSASKLHLKSEARPIEDDLVAAKLKTAKGKTIRKASTSQRNAAKKNKVEKPCRVDHGDDMSMAEEAVHEVETPVAQDLPTPQLSTRLSRSRRTSHASPAQRSQASESCTLDHVVDVIMDEDSPTVTARTVEDDSGNETDTSATSRASPKEAGVIGAGLLKNGKGGKKLATLSRDIEEVDQHPVPTFDAQKPKDEEASNDHEVVEPPSDAAVEETADLPSIASSQPSRNDIPAKEIKTTKRTAKSTKKKAGKPKSKAIFVDAPTPTVDEENDALSQDAQSAKQSSPQLIEISDPTPPRVQEPEATTANPSPSPQSPHQTTPSPSPQSSDAENRPPTGPPSTTRLPLSTLSPSTRQSPAIPLAARTPTSSRTLPSSRLQSTTPWTAVDLERVFLADEPSLGKENRVVAEGLTSPEKKMSVEQWILGNAARGEERLRAECERVVGRFEAEGVRALRAVEGIVVVEG